MNNDFSSIERLMEFGMSMAVAQQMITTMNQAIGNMALPGAGNPIPEPKREYYVVVDGAQAGPLNDEELKQLAAQGKVNAETLVWHRALTAWRRAGDVPEVMKLVLLSNTNK